MSESISQHHSGADRSLSNTDTGGNRHDESSSNGMSFRRPPYGRMASGDAPSASPWQRDRDGSGVEYSETVTLQDRSNSQERAAPRRINSLNRAADSPDLGWNREASNQSPEQSSKLEFEPQGELLHERQYQRQVEPEVTIPHSVSADSGLNRMSENVTNAHVTNSLIDPEHRPNVAAATAGVKRKSAPEIDLEQPDEQSSAKRPAMSSRGTKNSVSAERPQPYLEERFEADEHQSNRNRTDIPEHHTHSHSNSGATSRLDLNAPDGPRNKIADGSARVALPSRKVFPIQIGDKLFRLSGASISSDAPSYFSQFFEQQLRQHEGADGVRTLYIDRDPATFEDISLHLQGYHIEPRDGPHFVKLFADAQFFSLPRLTAQLFASAIYIRIGDTEFQVPRDLFNDPGNSPNYFSLGFSAFFTTPSDVFPGLSQQALLRPPSIMPPSIPHRSARVFADLLHVLKGYPLEIRSEEHRQELLRDARYFHLKGLEQRLIPHHISYNMGRGTTEIVIRLEDVRQSGIVFVANKANESPSRDSPAGPEATSSSVYPGWIYYQRPYVDSEAYNLILEITGEEETYLSLMTDRASVAGRVAKAAFHRQTLARITSLFSVIATKANAPIIQAFSLQNPKFKDERVQVRIGSDAYVTLNGRPWSIESGIEVVEHADDEMNDGRTLQQIEGRERIYGKGQDMDWIVKKAQWRLRVQPAHFGGRSGVEVVLIPVRIEAITDERARNAARGFLG
ncbi:hypothetical protein KC332_g7606 [Hortaea werneckii]|uniref:Potassium channel tetramerisation-type BTB domain-containing protein n=2 Tax=Hortaea werneckii TaxID=91943 RepID=A0A3M7IRB9_HORWE|nr:hypothetical protein KC358_g7316 [Hortaea werneckii]OTA29941.1 hypothetical protein BTJ68_10229 [Hortaea werneckii EXF-2000]KAI6834128.1 hypothetical protein KC350_g6786 [Hortaea werneckii]KAI6918767.1 hypothetical protein KC341_g17704 [Hortaea werneckii]KAI6929767.1 hypothetical protein KC348_g7758 [Hortaea werneckii]